jgi:hypothetical protein
MTPDEGFVMYEIENVKAGDVLVSGGVSYSVGAYPLFLVVGADDEDWVKLPVVKGDFVNGCSGYLATCTVDADYAKIRVSYQTNATYGPDDSKKILTWTRKV